MNYLAEIAIQDLFDRIPALRPLRGVERIEAEEVIARVVDDVIDLYIAECEAVASTGGAP